MALLYGIFYAGVVLLYVHFSSCDFYFIKSEVMNAMAFGLMQNEPKNQDCQ
tara:strand:- start:22831 stop:22983 length:153 start_codon:yes stop_codon:yes gene_type:complete